MVDGSPPDPRCGAVDQVWRKKKQFDLRDFEEKRPPHEVSLDWLGRTSVEPKVARDLSRQAQRMFAHQRPSRTFVGWVYLQAAKLSKGHKDLPCLVVSSPEMPGQPDHPDHNPYHIVIRPCAQFGHPYLVTQFLYLQFLNHGKTYHIPRFHQRMIARCSTVLRNGFQWCKERVRNIWSASQRGK